MKRILLILFAALLAPLPGHAKTRVLVSAWDGSSRLMGDLARAYEAQAPGVRVIRSHGGSSRQARAVLDGLPADALCVSEAADLDLLVKRSRLPEDWRKRFEKGGVPFGSPVVFVVRQGNPKGIRDWGDLAKPGVALILPNPSSSGSGRVDHLAALAWTQERGLSADDRFSFFKSLYGNVLSMESGSRGATLAFFERGLGDVLICWQSEASLALKRWPERGLLLWPSVTLMAEPRLAALSPAGEPFVRYLFSPAALAIAKEHGFVETGARLSQPGVACLKAAQLGDEHHLHAEQFGPKGLLSQVLEKR